MTEIHPFVQQVDFLAKQIPQLPFPMLFAEDVPSEYLRQISNNNILETLSQVLGRTGPTGKRDKILVLSNSKDYHTEKVITKLLQRGVPVCQFYTDEFITNCQTAICLGIPNEKLGGLRLPTTDLLLDEIKSVWFRRPNLPVMQNTNENDVIADFINREAEAALYGLFGVLKEAFWVSHPDNLKISDNKLRLLQIAESFGFKIPRTLVTNDPQTARNFFNTCKGEIIVKTFRGWSRSLSGHMRAICTSRVLEEHLEKYCDRIKAVPCLFQEYISKDVELRVTIIGRQIFPVEIHSQLSEQSRDDWRRYDLDNTPYYPCTLPSAVESACLKILDYYGLAYGAIDLIRQPDGTYVFLELNANGQYLWIENITNLPLTQTIADLLIKGEL